MKTFLVRGVPASLQRDGWWMDGPLGPPPSREQIEARLPKGWVNLLLLLALVLLADVLMWNAAPGLSLVLFGLALLTTALLYCRSDGWGGLVLGVVFSLPLLEHAQFLSVVFWICGLITGATWIALRGWSGLTNMLRSSIRFVGFAASTPVRDAIEAAKSKDFGEQRLQSLFSAVALNWSLPLVLGLVFIALLIEANPVLAQWENLTAELELPSLSRMLFWIAAVFLIWPFLRLSKMAHPKHPRATDGIAKPRTLPAALNPVSVRNSLVLFNLIFAVQTVLDATYLVGGASLPEGMAYATYAHRGAYPLLATALLAGVFALVARPFTEADQGLRLALLIWVVQTILLVASSILRLDLYVEVYGLTRLRLAAGIWMGLVAVGLCLTLWQVIKQRPAAWLLKRGAVLGLVTIYAAMFISFDRHVARYNLTHPVPNDSAYLCNLGSAALPEIRQHAPDLCDQWHGPYAPIVTDWREWGFRDWRTLRSLRLMNNQSARI